MWEWLDWGSKGVQDTIVACATLVSDFVVSFDALPLLIDTRPSLRGPDKGQRAQGEVEERWL